MAASRRAGGAKQRRRLPNAQLGRRPAHRRNGAELLQPAQQRIAPRRGGAVQPKGEGQRPPQRLGRRATPPRARLGAVSAVSRRRRGSVSEVQRQRLGPRLEKGWPLLAGHEALAAVVGEEEALAVAALAKPDLVCLGRLRPAPRLAQSVVPLLLRLPLLRLPLPLARGASRLLPNARGRRLVLRHVQRRPVTSVRRGGPLRGF